MASSAAVMRRSSLGLPGLTVALLLLAGCDSGSDPASGNTATAGSKGGAGAATGEGLDVGKAPPKPEKLSDEAYAAMVEKAKAQLDGAGLAGGGAGGVDLASVEADLRRVALDATDVHLRANASLLLGALAEGRGDRRTAISYYTQAQRWLPDEPSTHAVLALALAADGQHAKAAEVQKRLVELTPDDLQAWLIWGEMRFKAGDQEGATEVYAGYEMRRKGLLDGLTLKKDGKYVSAVDERVGCVENLYAASDNGTALALLYALDSDPAPEVQAAIVELMGAQRLIGYKPALEAHRSKLAKALAAKPAKGPEAKRDDADLKARIERVDWALAELARDGVETKPGVAPWDPKAQPPEADPKEDEKAGKEAPTAPSGAADGAQAG